MEYFDIETYEKINSVMYAPVYPLLARQVVDKTCITTGKCMDIGTGSGYFGIELAKITTMDVCLYDISPKSLELAAKTIANEGLQARLCTMLGDVHQISVANSSINLVVSRASIGFWKDRAKAFAEIYRILAPGGYAYVGSGFGTEELRTQVMKKHKELDFDWSLLTKLCVGELTPETLVKELEIANIYTYEILTEAGLWVIIHKLKP